MHNTFCFLQFVIIFCEVCYKLYALISTSVTLTLKKPHTRANATHICCCTGALLVPPSRRMLRVGWLITIVAYVTIIIISFCAVRCG